MAKYVFLYLIAIALATSIGTCRRAMTPDQQLVQAVRAAAAARTPPQDAEARVGATAIINTVRPGDREKYLFGHVELDTNEQSEVATLDAEDLAYWGRPITSENPRVVGIAWLADGSAKVFFAVVYPPG